jgi:predicted O-methyltransferase YrrM
LGEVAMNPVLEDMLRTRLVHIEGEETPRRLNSNMDREEGALIGRAIAAVRPQTTLEVGCAYGVSTLFTLDALHAANPTGRHYIVDPHQTAGWGRGGVGNAERAGYGHMIELVEENSETALPRLLTEGLRLQFAIVDGWHTFDHALVDCFFLNKMLDVGGIMIVDDTDWPALQRLRAHLLTYPCFEVFGEIRYQPPTLSGRLKASLHRDAAVTCIALRKITEDERNWDWHEPF